MERGDPWKRKQGPAEPAGSAKGVQRDVEETESTRRAPQNTHATPRVFVERCMLSTCVRACTASAYQRRSHAAGRTMATSISQSFTSDAIARSGRILSELTLVGIEVKPGAHWMLVASAQRPSGSLPSLRSELHDVTERIAASPASRNDLIAA